MTPEQKKELVCRILKTLLEKSDLAGVSSHLSEQIEWREPGDTFKGQRGHALIRDVLARKDQLFPEGLEVRMHNVHCDGDTVIVELTNRGHTFSGRLYENEYCFVCDLEGERIRRVTEYVDTHKPKDLLGMLGST
jgi:ketosteroid isomerase-like protein